MFLSCPEKKTGKKRSHVCVFCLIVGHSLTTTTIRGCYFIIYLKGEHQQLQQQQQQQQNKNHSVSAPAASSTTTTKTTYHYTVFFMCNVLYC
mmetsp:Transcript_17627/g.31052  ORF Transcript_17627/g.31052 Transcript_17627/m.31052 type:complete len:92 (+) Transcript_17627:275-550(+)